MPFIGFIFLGVVDVPKERYDVFQKRASCLVGENHSKLAMSCAG